MQYYNNELYHYGILGQKWGIRRYQNEDGSLTEEGRLRYKVDSKGKLQKLSKTERAIAAKKLAIEKDKAKPLKERNIEWMTDEELNKLNTRLNAEKSAYSSRNEIAKLNPKKQTIGEKISKKLVQELENQVVPSAVKMGKDYLEKELKTKLDLNNQETEAQRLKRELTEWTNKATIEKQKNVYYEELEKAKQRKGG